MISETGLFHFVLQKRDPDDTEPHDTEYQNRLYALSPSHATIISQNMHINNDVESARGQCQHSSVKTQMPAHSEAGTIANFTSRKTTN